MIGLRDNSNLGLNSRKILWLQKKHHEIIDASSEPTSNKQTSLAVLHKLNIGFSNYFDVAPTIINGTTISTTSETKTTEPENRIIVYLF